MSAAPRVAIFAMGEIGHFRRVRAVAEALVTAGADVRVWTDPRFAEAVAEVGARFVDLFAGRPLDAVDDRSLPVPARYVTFAGVHATAITREVAAWDPGLVVHDAFTLVGSLVARALARPWVTVLAGHAVHGPTFRARLVDDPRVAIDPRCLAAVARLRDEHGLTDASPLSYVADPSPWLNLYGQPAAWLTAAERTALGPLEAFGSLPASALDARPVRSEARSGLNVYAAFGAVVWRYFAPDALASLAAVADAVGRVPGARATLSLGGHAAGAEERARLARPGVTVHDWVDQSALLLHADVFVTHHGLGSTHEAIAARVPMIGRPFFWDQPALAARCRELDLSVTLPAAPRADHLADALATVRARADVMGAALERARRWEVETLADRPRVARELIALAHGERGERRV